MQCLPCNACFACIHALFEYSAMAHAYCLSLFCSCLLCSDLLTTLAGLHVAMLFEWCVQDLPSSYSREQE
jgi:hypothetical protein